MTRMKNKQAGFGIVEAVIAVLVMGVLAGAGWFVYQHNRTKVTNAAVGSQPTSQQTTTTTPPAPTVTYLAIKEWGIKLPLPNSIQDAYYVVDPGVSTDADGKPSAIEFGIAAQDIHCGAVTATNAGYTHALGAIVRALPTDTDPVSGKLYTQLDPIGVTIGGYYYGYANASLTSKTCLPAATIQAIDAALANAVKAATASPAN
jgi:pilin/secretion family protein with methylation motif